MNFVTIDCRCGGTFAQKVMQELLARDVFVRMPGVASLNRCVRIDAGLDADMDLFEEKLPEARAAAAR